MSNLPPVVYILHGDDEYAITQFLSDLEGKLGDAATAAMNTTRLDGKIYNPEGLLSVAGAMPFLAKRRVVILTSPLAKLTSPIARQKFREQLEKLPPTTALILVENRPLVDERDRRKGEVHWLERWAEESGGKGYVRVFTVPKGIELEKRIQEMAKQAGGQITPAAAQHLASLVGGDPRLADQEIHKLLAYVNYQRAVDFEDVQAITADMGEGDIFKLVDALGNQNGRQAMGMLHRLLEQQDALSIYGMIVRQFRLLLLARETLDRGGQKNDVIRDLKVAPFVADKLISQVRHFNLPDLEAIYHRLLDIDEAMKTSQVPGELALETLVAALAG